MKWLILLLGIAANASASVLIKWATIASNKQHNSPEPWSSFISWQFLLGVTLYGLTLLLYTAALARLPLNVAHPILTSGAVAVVSLCSIFIFREPFSWTTAIGILLVTTGVALITLQASG